MKSLDCIVSTTVACCVITLLGGAVMWSSNTSRSRFGVLGVISRIWSRTTLSAGAGRFGVVTLLSPFFVLVVCCEDRHSTSQSERADGPFQRQLGGCTVARSGGFASRGLVSPLVSCLWYFFEMWLLLYFIWFCLIRFVRGFIISIV